MKRAGKTVKHTEVELTPAQRRAVSDNRSLRTRQTHSPCFSSQGLPRVQDDFLNTPYKEWLCWNMCIKYKRADGTEYIAYPKEAPISLELLAHCINRHWLPPKRDFPGWKLIMAGKGFGGGRSPFYWSYARPFPATEASIRQSLGMCARTSGLVAPFPDDPSDNATDWTPIIRDLLSKCRILIFHASDPIEVKTEEFIQDQLALWRPQEAVDEQGFERPVWDLGL